MAQTASKGKGKVARKGGEVSKSGDSQEVESRAIKLAEQIGWLAGTVQYQAETWMDNETLKQQMTMIRDRASTILDQVNRAGSAAGESAARLADAAKSVMPSVKKQAAAKKAEAEETAAVEAKRAQSRKPVAAPGKKHRKPPPQVKVSRHAGAAAAQRFVDKPMPNRQRRG